MKLILLLFIIPFTAFAQHKATTIVQIHPGLIAINGAPGKILTKNYMANEYEAIVAAETLKLAAVSLNPGQKANLDQAIANLKKHITTAPVRGTDFIEITANAESQARATQIANAVTDAYIKRRIAIEKLQVEKAINALDAELIAQSDLMAKHREDLTKLIQKHGIPYFDGAPQVPDLKAAQGRLEDARPHERASILASIKIPNNPVTRPYSRYIETLEKIDHLRQNKPRTDPDLIATRKELNKARTELQQVSKKLSAIVKEKSEKLQARKIDPVEQSLQQHNYNEAKEKYEQSRTMLREMKIKQQEARVLLKMPRSPVTIYERAK